MDRKDIRSFGFGEAEVVLGGARRAALVLRNVNFFLLFGRNVRFLSFLSFRLPILAENKNSVIMSNNDCPALREWKFADATVDFAFKLPGSTFVPHNVRFARFAKRKSRKLLELFTN